MTENASPKPFNICHQKSQRRKLGREQLYWFINKSVNISINRSVYRQIGWTEFKSKTIKNV